MNTVDPLKNRQLAEHLRNLPMLPPTVVKVLQVFRERPGAVDLLAGQMESNPRFAEQFLSLANSPFYGIPRRLKKIRNAVEMLGWGEAEGMAVLLGVKELYPLENSRTVDRLHYWKQAIATGVIARHLAKQSHGTLSPSDSLIAGTLLNVGQLVLEELAGEVYLPVLEKTASEPTTELWMQEQLALGMTHASVSEKVLEHWNFSQKVRTPVLHHHSPALSTEEHWVPSFQLHLANYYSRLWLNAEDPRRPLLHGSTRAVLGISVSDEEFFAEIRPELTASEEWIVSLSSPRGTV